MSPTMLLVVAAGCAGAAAALLVPGRPRWPGSAPVAGADDVRAGGGRRALWAVVGAVGGLVLVPGMPGLAAAAVAAGVAWILAGRSEPAAVRAERAAVRRDLPYVVALFAAGLRAGAAPGDAIGQVCAALPGPAADRLAGVGARLALGLDPVEVWSRVADPARDPALAGLGRTMARAHATGAPVVTAVERLAEELARDARADVEERARAVGVRAAVPLGLCLLPAFVLIGIVPLAVALLTSLDL